MAETAARAPMRAQEVRNLGSSLRHLGSRTFRDLLTVSALHGPMADESWNASLERIPTPQASFFLYLHRLYVS